MMSDIYRIAVRLTMESNAAGVMAALSRQLFHVHAQIKDVEKGFTRVKAALVGGIAITAGSGLLGLVKHTLDATKELNHQLANTAVLASNPKESAALRAQALAVARATTDKVRGVRMDRAVEVFNETFSILGASGAAKTNEVLNRYAMVAGGASGNYSQAYDTIRDLVKSGEMSGKIMGANHQVDIDKLVGYLDMASKVTAATGGRVNARTFFQMAQQGGPGFKNMDDNGMLGMLVASQQMGGFRVGTATMSLFSQMTAGKMTQPVAGELKKYGLISGYEPIKGGGVRLTGQETEFQRSLQKDPLSAITLLRKALEAHGVTGDKENNAVFSIFSRQTVQRLMGDLMTNFESMIKERGRIAGAKGLKDQDDLRNAEDYERNIHNLHTAWENLMMEMGGPSMPVAISVLTKLTDGFRYLNGALLDLGPDSIRNIGEGIAILGASLVAAGGAALVLALGPAGWLVLGMGAIAAVFRTLAPQQFDEWVGGLKRLVKGIWNLDWKEVVAGIGQEFSAAIHLLPGKVTVEFSIAESTKQGLGVAFWADFQPQDCTVTMSSAPGAGDTRDMVTGEGDKPTIDWLAGKISFSSRDKSAKLTEKKKNKKYQNQKSSDVVSDLAQDVGLQAQATSTSGYAGLKYGADYVHTILNRSHWEAMDELADREGFRWYVDGDSLYFEPEDQSNGAFQINYTPPTQEQIANGNIVHLRTSRNLPSSRPHKVTVKSWHHEDKKQYEDTESAGGSGDEIEHEHPTTAAPKSRSRRSPNPAFAMRSGTIWRSR